MSNLRSGLLAGVAIVILAGGASTAHAQSEPAKNPDAETSVNEIVVNARRTSENIQSVPVSITAFSAESLRQKQIVTPEDIQASTPGVFLSGSGGRQNVAFSIRGQSKALSGPSSPAVIGYFAEVPNPTFGSFVPQFDMASVQVLKGPQGTLFGRNTTGGAILFQPQKPTHEFGGYAVVTSGNYDNREIEGVVNAPLSDSVALRVGGNYHKRDGYSPTLSIPDFAFDNINDYNIRGSLLIEPSANFSNVTIVDFYRSATNGTGQRLASVAPGFTLLSLLGLKSGFQSRLAAGNARPFNTLDEPRRTQEYVKRFGITNRSELTLGPISVVNIFGYRFATVAYTTNVGTGRVIADGTGPFPAGTPVDLILASLNQTSRQFSNELQFKGTILDDKLDWMIGGFYLRSNPAGPQSNLVGFAQVPGFEDGRTAYNFITEDSKAVFGHVTYDLGSLVNGLEFEAGVRYTKDKVQSCAGIGPSGRGDDVQPGECLTKLTSSAITRANSSAWTFSAGLNWKVTDKIFLYGVTRKGYRAGGVNSPILAGRLTQFQTFAPEVVNDIEGGLRSEFQLADQLSLRFNVSGYVGWYKNVQSAVTGVQTPAGGCTVGAQPPASPDGDCNAANDPAGGTLLVNLGRARVSGVDIDGLLQVGRRLTLNYGASFLSPKTTSFNAPAAIAPFVADSQIPFNFAARKTFTAGVRYAVPDLGNLGEFAFTADYYWSDQLPFSGALLPSYNVVNARVELNSIGGTGVDVSIFARNLFQEKYYASGAATGAFLGFLTATPGVPRTYGISLRYSFGAR